MFRPKRLPKPSSHIRSDRALAAGIARRDTSALGQLYDRYAGAIYTLARQRHAAAAEITVEQVFGNLWTASQNAMLPGLVAPMMLDLAANALSGTPEPAVPVGSDCGSLDALARLGRSHPLACSVLVLVCLGKMSIAESAAVLEVEQTAVRQALTLALGWLRQFQPAATTETLAVPMGVLVAVHADPQGGAPASAQQPA